MSDPLTALPVEIVLHIVDLLPPSGVAKLSGLSKTWYSFIEHGNQDWIFSSPSKVDRPPECRDFSFLSKLKCFTNYYNGVDNWKELCKRQTLLRGNLNSSSPVTRETIFQIGLVKIWRFRADFKRRLIVSTSEFGGLDVTDMDSGNRLWRNALVREYGHLEYDEKSGTAAWDAFGDIIEVWRLDPVQRGVFRLVQRVQLPCQTRGFEIKKGTLAVVSSDGQGFVYDLGDDDVHLRKQFEIEHGAIGHLCQDDEVVMFSMGPRGYHIHSKETGEKLGVLDPDRCTNISHIKHDDQGMHDMLPGNPTPPAMPPQRPQPVAAVKSLALEPGPRPPPSSEEAAAATEEGDPQPAAVAPEDEWGAGLLDGDLMAAISKQGRVFICSNWRQAMAGQYNVTSSIVQCEVNPHAFDLGGWLSLRNGRVAFEVDNCIYMMSATTTEKSAPVWAMLTASDSRHLPVSFMAIWDDCFMHTYVTLCPLPELGQDLLAPMKTIRVLSFAPDLG